MSRRFAPPVGLTILVVAAALASVPLSGATSGPPPTDYDSPYIAEIDTQLPTNIPWQDNSEAKHRARFAKLYSVGIRWVYVWVPWTLVETSQGVYSFTKLDDYIGWARAEGLLVQLQVMTGPWSEYPSWIGPRRVNPIHTGGENVPSVDLSYAVSFWVALVNRYKPGGALAVERGWTDGYGVRNWEVENEPGASVIPGNPSWGRVPKDYAAFLSMLYPAAKAAYGATNPYGPMVISAPALAQTDPGSDPLGELLAPVLSLLPPLPLFGPPDALDGITWLDQVLTPGPSEWQSSTYTAAPTQAGGPFIDAFSFHYDNVNPSDGLLPARAQAMKNLMNMHSAPTQTIDPVKPNAELWYTEGGALSYATPLQDNTFAWAEQQIVGFLLGKQVDRMIFAFGTQFGDLPLQEQNLALTPIGKASIVTTRYFPRSGNVVPVNIDSRVTAFKRTDPSSGKWTYMLWANDVAAGQTAGAPFTVDVPLRSVTTQVDFVDSAWVTTVVNASSSLLGKSVPVTLTPAEVSPVFVIAER